MIVKLESLSKEELVEMNKRAIVQISKLIDEKQKLEQELKDIKVAKAAKEDINLGAKAK